MKFGKDFAAKPVATGNQTDTANTTKQVSPVTDISYDKEKADPNQDERSRAADFRSLPIWKKEALKYIQVHSLKLVGTLRDALVQRQNGEKVITIREASILARGGQTLTDFVWAALLAKGVCAFIGEDEWELEDNIYDLRIRYNAGIAWMKGKRHLDTIERVKAGDELMASIRAKLSEVNLSMYEEEMADGFTEELLRPEWGKREMFLHRQKKLLGA